MATDERTVYRPDTEARELAWENAASRGARQTRPHLSDVDAMRQLHAQADDPLGLDRDGPDLALDEVPWRTDDDPRMPATASDPRLVLGAALVGPMQDMTAMFQSAIDAAAAIERSMVAFRAATGMSADGMLGLMQALQDEANRQSVPAAAFIDERLRRIAQAATRTSRPQDAPRPLRRSRPEGRHGSASTCPRHGPTRGGLCRRCHR